MFAVLEGPAAAAATQILFDPLNPIHSKHSLNFDSSFVDDCSDDHSVAERGSRRLVQGDELLVGHMPVVRHRLIRRRDLNPVPALLEETVHRPLRVKDGPVDPHVAGYPFSDLLAG